MFWFGLDNFLLTQKLLFAYEFSVINCQILWLKIQRYYVFFVKFSFQHESKPSVFPNCSNTQAQPDYTSTAHPKSRKNSNNKKKYESYSMPKNCDSPRPDYTYSSYRYQNLRSNLLMPNST